MRIALAQIDCRLGNIPANIATHRAALKAAQEKNQAELVVFPELSITGYRLRSNIHRVMLNDAQFSNVWEKLQQDETLLPATTCVLGYVELSQRGVLHNTTTIINGASPIPLHRHRKVYLPTYGMFEEERYMRPGYHFHPTTLTLADGETWRTGILNCEDAWHASTWTIMQAHHVDLVIVPSASPGRGVESERLGSQRSWYGILSTMAELCGCWVIFCNRVGFEDDIHFWGGSAVFSPNGERLVSAALLDSDLLTYQLEKRVVTTARITTPLAADEHWDVTIRELQHARQSDEDE